MKKNRYFLQFYIKLLPKLSNFMNSDDCIRKITSKSIRLYSVFIQQNPPKRIFNPSRYTDMVTVTFTSRTFHPCFPLRVFLPWNTTLLG